MDCPDQVGAAIPEIDAGRRAVVQEKRDEGAGQRGGEETSGAG